MKIGILGSGPVAQALAGAFIKYGYQIMLGSRNPEKLKVWQEHTGHGVQTGSFEEAAQFGELVVLAVKGVAAESALKLAGLNNLKDKTIIDVTNPIADLAPDNGVLRFFTTLDQSLMEQLQLLAPDSNFVKAFNSVGNAVMVDPNYGDIKPTMFICGDNDQAKEAVTEILEKFGWEVADMGGKEAARAIEPLCILWCIPGLLRNEWNHAFKLLHR